MDKNVSVIAALYKLKHAESFRAAWDKALALGQGRPRRSAPGAASLTSVTRRA